LNVIHHPKATEELLEAASYYAKESSELARRFRNEVQSTLDRVIATPKQFPVIRNGRRRALVTTFPYYILFELRGNQIGILAILHAKRHPDTGHDREL
jgi:plasmid stabilization system protein ParE